ncbi:hypothetical protein [Flavobacterium microcysteis]|nr:hypothetical protein [Flavobacterium microcysteis]
MKTITGQNRKDFIKIFPKYKDVYNPAMEKMKRHLITFYQL